MTAPSVEDLELAATWLEEYEAGPDADGQPQVDACRRVAAALRRQAARLEARQRDAEVVARCAQETGRPLAECRAALRRLQARRQAAG